MNEVMSACGLESRTTWMLWERHGQWSRFSCSSCGEGFKKKILPDTCPNCKNRIFGIRDLTE